METPFDYDEGVGAIRGSKRFVVTGFLQICLGVVSLTAGLVSGLLNWHPNYQGIELFDRLFVGVWAGLFFIVTGGVGVLRFRKPRGVPLTYLVLSILAAILPFLGILVTALSLLLSTLGPMTDTSLRNVNLIVNISLILIFLLEFIISLVASIFACSSIATRTRGL
ncbi:uncharacterized protein [Apostichopus japonicus]|uniref:uncharacterized protein n=1 Tax=Stichopus japonicus TaxID=307972 RepID=UPI003AB360F4